MRYADLNNLEIALGNIALLIHVLNENYLFLLNVFRRTLIPGIKKSLTNCFPFLFQVTGFDKIP